MAPFAVKMIREDDEEKLQAHRKEFQLAYEMSHPNVVKAIEIFENPMKKQIHIIMQHVNGQEIFDQLAELEAGFSEGHA